MCIMLFIQLFPGEELNTLNPPNLFMEVLYSHKNNREEAGSKNNVVHLRWILSNDRKLDWQLFILFRMFKAQNKIILLFSRH